jgi:hypothetical protein
MTWRCVRLDFGGGKRRQNSPRHVGRKVMEKQNRENRENREKRENRENRENKIGWR